MQSNIHKVDEVEKFLPQQWYLLVYDSNIGFTLKEIISIIQYIRFTPKDLATNIYDDKTYSQSFSPYNHQTYLNYKAFYSDASFLSDSYNISS